MFIFAHIGITLGAATLVSGAIANWQHFSSKKPTDLSDTDAERSIPAVRRSFSEIIGFKTLADFLDIRLLILGSIFPDIIDKPLEFARIGNGRFLAHTLLAALLVLIIGLYLFFKYKKTWLLAIVIGMFSHLILDSMWLAPHMLFWPLLGWSLPGPANRPGFIQISYWWNILVSNRGVQITEGTGLIIILGNIWMLNRMGKLKSLLVQGKI